MKLNNSSRDVFVRAVMDDVPSVDYHEQLRKAIQQKALDLLPPKVRAIVKEHGDWVAHKTSYSFPGRSGVIFVSNDERATRHAMQEDTVFWSSLQDLEALAEAQTVARTELRNKVKAAIYACTTVKQAHEQLPEFAKYLPELAKPIDRTVPAIANLVADLNAAGWPKGTKPAARKIA